MSKIQINRISSKSQLCSLDQAESNEVNGGFININTGIIVDPDIIINPQIAVNFGDGGAFNGSGNDIFSGNGIGQFNFNF